MAKSRNRIPATPRRTHTSNSTALVPIDRPMFYGGPDPITINKMHLVVNEVRSLMREQYDRASRIDPRRDFNAECGYPQVDLTAEGYRDLIATEPVAELVNAIYPLESWKSQPKIYDSDDPSDITPFMEALDDLPSMMGVEPSYHVQDSNSLLWPFLLNADILAGYNRYGIILIGLDDGEQDLRQPVVPKAGMKVTFLQAFPEHLAKISSFEMNKSSPRYGMPTQYMIRMSDPYEQSRSEINEPYTTEYVHWSRVIHITDHWHTASSSRIFGIPRCKPVLHPILDVKKVRGSSAEMYYKGAFFGLHFGTHPQLGPDADVDRESLEDMYEEYINGLQRAVFTSGMTVDPLSPTVVDPTPQIEVQLTAISIKMRTPKRVLMGSERGELSSADDRKDYNGKLMSRQALHNGPKVAVPLIDRFINFGVLPRPRNPGYRIWWPDLASLSELEKTQVLKERTTSYGIYVSQGVESAIPLRTYMTSFDGMDEEEAENIINILAEGMEGESETAAPLLGLVGGVDAMLQMFDRFGQGAMSEETLKQLIMLFYKVSEDKALEIIADGLPEPPKGSERDLPPLPPMKGPNAQVPLSKSPIVANWLVNNVFCATGPGGGIDPTCSPGGTRVGGKGGSTSKGTGKRVKEFLKEKATKVAKVIQEQTSRIKEYQLFTGDSNIGSDIQMMGTAISSLSGLDKGTSMIIGAAIVHGGGAVGARLKKGIEKIDKALYEDLGEGTKTSPTSKKVNKGTASDPTTPTPSNKTYNPNVEAKDKDGITKASRVGVPAASVPPPPALKSLPNLTPREREIEQKAIEKFNKDPDGMAKQFREIVLKSTKAGEPPTFGTDDAKALHPAWGSNDNLTLAERAQNRATLNTPLHQVANATAKRAFLQHLDTLKKGDEVLVTVGGVGAGKGYALKNVPEALSLKQRSKVVWDSAGDQNATENTWLRKELKKRGLKGNFLYVHADAYDQWSNPVKGVVSRAAKPEDGRMVDAKVFADSYAIGAKNHQKFYDKYKNSKDMVFFFIDNTGKPIAIPGIPKSALNLDRKALAKFAIEEVMKSNAPEHVKRGATVGSRIWKD